MKPTRVTSRSLSSRLDRHFAAASALVAAAAVGGAARTAEATIVYSGTVDINIPSTTAGIYLNVVTGVNNAVPGNVPGWDVNPWNATSLYFFNPTAPTGGVYVGAATAPANLAPGTLIDGSSTYGSGQGAGFNTSSSNNLVGFRFQNEGAGNATMYGWMRISLASTLGGQPRAIVEYAYEDTGAAIAAGDAGAALGACCAQNGTCQANVAASACIAGGGSWVNAPDCATASCPPGGSCCQSGGTCVIQTSSACTASGGIWGGANTACGVCTGACCATDGTCSIVSPQTCATVTSSTYLGNGSACACQPISFLPLPLTYNWNGLVSTGVEQGAANYNDPNGYRSIADRGLLLGAGGSITSGVTGTDEMPYTISTADHALDIVHLGDRRTVANAARNWSGTGANNNAAQPSWLLENDQATIPQVSTLSSVSATLTAESRIGVIYQVSDSGGRFDCKLTFTDTSTATVTLRAADWFSNNNPQHPGPAAGSGLIVQRKLGSYAATQDTDNANTTANNLDVVEAVMSVPRLAADGFGNFAGKRLASITFQNPVSNANYANSTPATGSGFAILAATLSYPGTACYANCDNSTTAPVLNVSDFTCFLQKYAAQDLYANCDGSTTQPVLNVQDFTCFLQKYAAGCP